MRIGNKFKTLALAVICGISVMVTSVKAEIMYNETEEEIVVVEQAGIEGKLETPKNPRIDATGNECYTTAFMWDKVDGASKYEIEYYRNGEKKTGTTYSLYYFVSPIGAECDFTFKVRAVNALGESSEWSAAIEYKYVSPGNQLAAPDNVKWDENHFGTVTWNPVEGASGYRIVLRCNGKQMAGYSGKYSVCSYDFKNDLKDEGVYTVTIYAYPADINICRASVGGESNELSYTLPEQKIPAPANFQINKNSTNLVLMWDEIDSVTRYNYEIYWNGEKQSSGYSSYNRVGLKGYLDKQEGSGELLIKVQAVSYDKLHYADSDWAEFRYVKPSKKLEMPTDVKWGTGHFGEITWNPVEGAEKYEGELFYNGESVITFSTKSCEIDFCRYMFEDGEYTVVISAVPTDITAIFPSDKTVSNKLNYKVPEQKASTPTNIHWEGTVLKWDAVENVSWYSVEMNRNGQFSFGVWPSGTSFDMKSFFERYGDGTYTVKISALSDDLTKCGHSNYAVGPEYVVGEPEYTEEQREQVRNFVKRLYQVILNREAEEDGLNAWTKQLLGRKATGAQLVAGFVESDEFTQRGLTNEEVVEIMYQAMLGRTSDEGGKAGWSKILNNGCSYLNIVNGFSGSVEFNEICGSYGIIAGTVELNRQRDKNPQLTAFVARCYTQALGRQYETGGLEGWCDAIISGRNTPKQVAQNFIFSEEFVGKNLNNEEYVKVLYRTFMGREADEGGLNAWVEVLKSGREDRAKVLEGFSDSVEFAEILASFGLK